MAKLKSGFELLLDLLSGFGSKAGVDIDDLTNKLDKGLPLSDACQGINRVMNNLSCYDSRQLMFFHGAAIDYLNSLIEQEGDPDNYYSVIDGLLGQAQESFFGRRLFSLDRPKELLILCRDYLNKRLEKAYDVNEVAKL